MIQMLVLYYFIYLFLIIFASKILMGVCKISQELFLSLFIYLDKLGDISREARDLLLRLAWKLYDLNRKRSISINHSIMEILVASYLAKNGYEDIDVEAPVGDLVADVVAIREGKKLVVEIETGFTPADHSIDPIEYLKARIASKIARYSSKGDVFALAFPIYYIPPIPVSLLKPPSMRQVDELIKLMETINQYYKNPPIDIKDLMKAKVDELYILYIDKGKVIKISPGDMLSLRTYLYSELDPQGFLFNKYEA
ncbi:MAG: hypothetical protein QXE01_01805 [Sulfolobales archaeon]